MAKVVKLLRLVEENVIKVLYLQDLDTGRKLTNPKSILDAINNGLEYKVITLEGNYLLTDLIGEKVKVGNEVIEVKEI